MVHMFFFFSANLSLVSPILSRSAVQSFYDPSLDVVCIGANCKPGTLLEYVPSGKLTFCFGKSPFLMGKLIINGHFQ